MMPAGELWRSQESVSCPYSTECVEGAFCELPHDRDLGSNSHAIGDMLPPADLSIFCPRGYESSLLIRPYPGSQVESLYLPFPELRLDDAIHPVRGLVACERPYRPGHPIACYLLL